LKAGDVGSLPVIVGMLVIVIFFTVQSSAFFTAVTVFVKNAAFSTGLQLEPVTQ